MRWLLHQKHGLKVEKTKVEFDNKNVKCKMLTLRGKMKDKNVHIWECDKTNLFFSARHMNPLACSTCGKWSCAVYCTISEGGEQHNKVWMRKPNYDSNSGGWKCEASGHSGNSHKFSLRCELSTHTHTHMHPLWLLVENYSKTFLEALIPPFYTLQSWYHSYVYTEMT